MAMLPARSWRLASHAHRLHDLITPSVGKRFSAPSPSFMDKSALPSAARSNKVESTTSVGHEAGPSTRVVVVAIDPDTKGAIALASWMASPSVTSVKEPEVSSTGGEMSMRPDKSSYVVCKILSAQIDSRTS
eukprot:gene15946-22080_t